MIVTSIPDLLLQSRVRSILSRIGQPCRNETSREKLIQAVTVERSPVVILDLENPAHDAAGLIRELTQSSSEVKVVGFHSHVNHEIRRECLQAGCSHVLTRSQLEHQLPAIIESAHVS